MKRVLSFWMGVGALFALPALSVGQVSFSFETDTQGWGATTWDGAGTQSVTTSTIGATDGTQSLAASIGEGGYRWITNIWSNNPGNAFFQTMDLVYSSGWADVSTITFDVTVEANTAPGATYFEVISFLQGDGSAFEQTIVGSFSGAELLSGATKQIQMSYNLTGGATSIVGGHANYQFGIGVNSDWTGGTIYIDNVQMTAVPEPSTYAAFAGLGVLGFLFYRRRKLRMTEEETAA